MGLGQTLAGEWNMSEREGREKWPASRRTFVLMLFESARGTYTWRDDSRKVPFEEGSFTVENDVLTTVAGTGTSAGEPHTFTVTVDEAGKMHICQLTPTPGLKTIYTRA